MPRSALKSNNFYIQQLILVLTANKVSCLQIKSALLATLHAKPLASKAFNIFVRMFFGLPFKDTQCGAKVFKKEAILDILDDLKTSGFEIDVEILWRLKKRGYRVIEYPITWKHSEGSKFRLSHSGGMFISLLRTRFKRGYRWWKEYL